jgi:hypothetical protein
MQTVTQTPYSSSELSILKECFQLTGTMLSNFINLLEHVEELSNNINQMIETVDNIQVPYCYEYIRVDFQLTFNDIKGHIDELKHSMFYFPEEVDNFLAYIKNEPSSNNHNELLGMLDATYHYYCARYDVIKTKFHDNKNLASECYDATRHLPRPCGT